MSRIREFRLRLLLVLKGVESKEVYVSESK
jgi:hypothetical protein